MLHRIRYVDIGSAHELGLTYDMARKDSVCCVGALIKRYQGTIACNARKPNTLPYSTATYVEKTTGGVHVRVWCFATGKDENSPPVNKMVDCQQWEIWREPKPVPLGKRSMKNASRIAIRVIHREWL